MLGRISNMKLRYKVGFGVATTAAVVGMAGGAFAYFTATGTGTGSATTGTSSAMTLIQDSTVNAAQLVPGVAAQTITGHQYNSAGTTEFVGAVTPSISNVTETDAALCAWGDPNFATDGAGCTSATGTQGSYTCSASDYSLTPSAAAGDEKVGPNATQPTSSANDFSLGTIAFNDTGMNQDACEGATLTLSFSS